MQQFLLFLLPLLTICSAGVAPVKASSHSPSSSTSASTTRPTSTSTPSAFPSASPSANCTFGSTYNVAKGDTATTISTKQGVSTRAILNINGLNPQGTDLIADSTICIPPPCKVHAVVSGDTCASVAKQNAVSLEAFKWWNLDVDGKCTNLIAGFNVCVSEPKKK